MSVPVEPDAPIARQWLRDELADPAYEAAQPGLVERGLWWLVEVLTRIEPPSGPPGAGLVALLVVVAVVVLLALRVAGPWAGARARGGPVAPASARPVSADEHREQARAAQADERWHDAVREWFRAVVRDCEERALLTARTGRTADEAAAELGELFPALAGDLGRGARRFDAVTYGSRPATADQAAALAELDAAVARARPVLADASAGGDG